MKTALPILATLSVAAWLSSCATGPADRVEDRYDRREDRYDRRHYSGPGDHIESRADRIENRYDRRPGRHGAWY